MFQRFPAAKSTAYQWLFANFKSKGKPQPGVWTPDIEGASAAVITTGMDALSKAEKGNISLVCLLDRSGVPRIETKATAFGAI